MAEEMDLVGGRTGVVVCYMYYNDTVTKGKPTCEENCNLSVLCKIIIVIEDLCILIVHVFI